MAKLQDMFMSSNLHSRTVEDNWNLSMLPLHNSISKPKNLSSLDTINLDLTRR